LLNQVNIQLENTAHPRLKLTIEVEDKGNALSYLRLGNSFWVHCSKLYLPGGKVGWRGLARIIVMAYNENNNTVSLSLEARM